MNDGGRSKRIRKPSSIYIEYANGSDIDDEELTENTDYEEPYTKRRRDSRTGSHRRDPRTGSHRHDPRTGSHRRDLRTGTHRRDSRHARNRTDYRTGTPREDPRRGTARPVRFKTVSQEWDINNRCPYCNCLFLQSESIQFRKKCCGQGSFINDTSCPQLNALPQPIADLLLNNMEHMSLLSAYYNKMLSIVCVGAENNTGGNAYQRFNGVPHTIRLQGSTY